jgi:general secretion pathway protein D
VAGALSLAACSSILAADAAAPARSANTQPTTRAATGPTTLATRISINFKDAPLDTVIEFLSQSAGFAIVKEGPLEGRVTIVSKQPVSPEEAITLVNAGLKVNGFTAIREGRVLRIAARDKAKKGNIPVHFGGKPEDVDDSEELITQVIPIQNVSATKLRDDLKPMIGTDADVTSNEGSNTIIITDSSSSIRRIVKIISNLDQHEATTAEIRIVQLKYANAANTVKLIDTFFKNQGGGGQMSQEMMMRMQQSGQPMMPQHSGSEKHGNNVIAAADDRTNTLVIMGSTSSLKLIDDIIKHLDSNPIPASEMKTYQLKFAQAEATAKLINNLFKPPKSNNDDYPFFYRRFGGDEEAKKNVTVNAAFDERTNSLIITAPADALKGVEDMIKTLDASPMASADIKVFQLKYADAYLTSKLIEDMFKPKDDSGPRFPYFIFGDNPNPPTKGVKVNVTSDDRTNSLIVSAPTELLKIIEGIIVKLDANPGSEDTLFIYHLRNAQAGNLESVLNVLFGNVQGQGPGGGQNGQQGLPGQDPQQQQGNRSSGRFGSNSGSGNSDSVLTRNNSNRRSNGGLNQPGMPRLSPGMAHAINELTGKVFVVADPDTNALLVTTASKYEKQVRLIIDDLDRAVPQVLIKVLIAEVTHDDGTDVGAEFSVLNLRANGQGSKGGVNFGLSKLAGGLVAQVVENNFTATIRALESVGKLDVLSRPYILASDNQLARITVGQEVPFIDNSRITDTGQTINTLNYKDVGILLDVIPHINSDGLVILDVAPEISALTGETVPISDNASQPIIAKRSAQTRVGIRDGQTIVIGGLMEDRKTQTIDKVPILGDIPLLGEAFKHHQDKKTKTELLIFLTPHVAQKPDALEASSNEETRGTKLLPGAVAPGVFDQHMQQMRSGQSAQTQPTQPSNPVNSIDLSEPPNNPDSEKELDPAIKPPAK